MTIGAATTYGAALANARAMLAKAGAQNPALDARILLAHAAGLDTTALIARGGEELPTLVRAVFDAHLERRVAGEPVARILGQKEFWGLSFEIGPAALAPRPETELLVEVVLQDAGSRLGSPIRICDLGSGSGAILIALLCELPHALGNAVDISGGALEIAKANAERLGVAERISFHRADFADGPDGPFDVVVSNPPYIAGAAIAGLPPEVRDHDPRIALDGGGDGLEAYRAILARIPRIMKSGGMLALEIGSDQGEAVVALCRRAGLLRPEIRRDLAGLDRVVSGDWTVAQDVSSRAKKALGKVGVTG